MEYQIFRVIRTEPTPKIHSADQRSAATGPGRISERRHLCYEMPGPGSNARHENRESRRAWLDGIAQWVSKQQAGLAHVGPSRSHLYPPSS